VHFVSQMEQQYFFKVWCVVNGLKLGTIATDKGFQRDSNEASVENRCQFHQHFTCGFLFTKVLREAVLYLHFRFDFFLLKNIGTFALIKC
jgi:hypothetical protein